MLTGLTLVVERGPQAGCIFHLTVPSSSVIGRSSDCDVVIWGESSSNLTSRFQCRIDVTHSGARVCEFDCCHSTLLNGQPISRKFVQPVRSRNWWVNAGQPLVDGDRLEFDGVVLRVAIEDLVSPQIPSWQPPLVHPMQSCVGVAS